MSFGIFQPEVDVLYKNFNPDEMDGNSKAIFAAVLTLQLRRKGYRKTMTPTFNELGVDRDDVERWYKELFGDAYYGPKRKKLPVFEQSSNTTLTPHELVRMLNQGLGGNLQLGHLYVAIESGGLPARKKDGVYQIRGKNYDQYRKFFMKHRPITNAAKAVGTDHNTIRLRIEADMIKPLGNPPYALVDVDEVRVAINEPVLRQK